jgi:hypothetical protein
MPTGGRQAASKSSTADAMVRATRLRERGVSVGQHSTFRIRLCTRAASSLHMRIGSAPPLSPRAHRNGCERVHTRTGVGTGRLASSLHSLVSRPRTVSMASLQSGVHNVASHSSSASAANLFPCRSPCCFSSRPVPTRWAASSGADEGQTKAPPGERRAGQVGRKVAGPHPASLQDAADPLTAGKRPSRQWHPTALSTTAARKAAARVEGMGRSCLRSGHSGK